MEYRPGAIYQYYYLHGVRAKRSGGFYRLDHYDPKTGLMDMYWFDHRNEPEEKTYQLEDREHFRLAPLLAQVLYGTEKIKS